MRRVVLVVGVAALLLLAPTGGAASTAGTTSTAIATNGSEDYVVGSSHVDDQELSTGTLTNLTVQGSGTSAYITLKKGNILDDFEDGDITTKSSDWDGWNGDTGSFSADSQTVISGSYSGKLSASGAQKLVATTRSSDTTENLTWTFNSEDTGNSNDRTTFKLDSTSIGNLNFYHGNGEVTLYSDTSHTVATSWASGSDITVKASFDYAADEVTIYIDGSNKGTFPMGSSESGLNQFDVLLKTDGSGSSASVWVDDLYLGEQLQTGGDSGQYVSANSSLSRPAQQTWTNLTLENATADVRQEAWTGSSWTVVNSSTYSSTGNYTLNVSGTSYTKWRSNISFQNQTGQTTAKLHDEGWLIETRSPSVDNSSLSPNTTSTTEGVPLTLEVNITDPDFGISVGESLTVDWVVDGSIENTTTVTSNGTATATVNPSAGEHDWHVEITDDQGHTVTSNTAEFVLADELRIYNESAPTELVDNITVDVEFFVGEDQDLIETRSATNGRVNMSGLPVDEPFVITAEANGYVTQRIFVENLTTRQSVYLLPESSPSVSPTFELQDYTGDFDQEETVLIIQRSLNGEWENVEGDYFGAAGTVPSILRYNKRHRLILVNTETGQRKKQGAYTPQTGGTQQIIVRPREDIQIAQFDPITSVEPSTRTLSAVNSTTITSSLDNQSAPIDTWSVEITHVGQSNTTLVKKTVSGPAGGEVPLTVNTSMYANDSIVVNVTWVTTSGNSGSDVVVYHVARSYDNEWSLLSVLGDLPIPQSNADPFRTMLATVLSVMITAGIASQMRMSTEMVGLTALASISAFSIIGWIPYGVVFVGGASFAAMAGLRRGL